MKWIFYHFCIVFNITRPFWCPFQFIASWLSCAIFYSSLSTILIHMITGYNTIWFSFMCWVVRSRVKLVIKYILCGRAIFRQKMCMYFKFFLFTGFLVIHFSIPESMWKKMIHFILPIRSVCYPLQKFKLWFRIHTLYWVLLFWLCLFAIAQPCV